jgi:hypothetical protein
MTVLTSHGQEEVLIHSRAIRGEIARHLNAVRRYLELGDDRRLRQFEDTVLVLVDGQEFELASDLATVERLGLGGEVHFDLYRR